MLGNDFSRVGKATTALTAIIKEKDQILRKRHSHNMLPRSQSKSLSPFTFATNYGMINRIAEEEERKITVKYSQILPPVLIRKEPLSSVFRTQGRKSYTKVVYI